MFVLVIGAAELLIMQFLEQLLPESGSPWLATFLDASLITLIALATMRFLARADLEIYFTSSTQLRTGIIVFGTESLVMLALSGLAESTEGLDVALIDAVTLSLVTGTLLTLKIRQETPKSADQPSLKPTRELSLFWTYFYTHLATLALLLSVGLTQFHQAKQRFDKVLFEEEQRKLETIELVFMADLWQLSSSTLLLSQQPHFADLHAEESTALEKIADSFRQQIAVRSDLKQISFIDSRGWEQVKLLRTGSEVHKAPRNELRYHGHETMLQAEPPPGVQIRRSALSGVQAVNHRPSDHLIEIFAPVWDADHRFLGLVSNHYLLPSASSLLDRDALGMKGRVLLSGRFGDVMDGTGSTPLPDNLAILYPEGWKRMQEGHVGRFSSGETVVLFHKVAPAAETENSDLLAASEHWWLTSSFDIKGLEAEYRDEMLPYVILFVLVAVLAGIMTHLSIATYARRYRERKLLEQHAFSDFLTGLANRHSFRDNLYKEMERARRTHSDGALIYLDLDDFKQANDELGHDAGDRILVTVAQRIKGSVRPYDLVARLGGDEFGVILVAPTDKAEIAAIAERIISRINQPIELEEQPCRVGSSLGIAIFSHDQSESVDELIRRGDEAMYTAKESGKNHFRFYPV